MFRTMIVVLSAGVLLIAFVSGCGDNKKAVETPAQQVPAPEAKPAGVERAS